MRILGLSGAAKVVSIGLIDENMVLAETTVTGVQSEKIMFYVKEAGIESNQIDGVAVAVGPGSYSGLRGSLAAAKALAQTLNIPLVGVSTLEAIAYNLIDIEGTMAVIIDARGDEYNFALFGASGGKLNRLTDDLVIKLDRLIGAMVERWIAQMSGGKIWLVGSFHKIGGFVQLTGDNFHFADEIHGQPYGINVAKLGLLKIKAGQTDDPLTLAPRYSHQPNIREFML